VKNMLPLIALSGIAVAGFGQGEPTLPSHCIRTRTSFDLILQLPYAEAAPLFGPEGERAWAGKHWNPEFIYPQPAHDEAGAVFTVSQSLGTAVWVNTLFDLNARHIQYVYFLPDWMVTTIDVRFQPVDTQSTRVNVEYTRTALKSQGNELVQERSEADARAGKEWQAALDHYLASRKPVEQHRTYSGSRKAVPKTE